MIKRIPAFLCIGIPTDFKLTMCMKIEQGIFNGKSIGTKKIGFSLVFLLHPLYNKLEPYKKSRKQMSRKGLREWEKLIFHIKN